MDEERSHPNDFPITVGSYSNTHCDDVSSEDLACDEEPQSPVACVTPHCESETIYDENLVRQVQAQWEKEQSRPNECGEHRRASDVSVDVELAQALQREELARTCQPGNLRTETSFELQVFEDPIWGEFESKDGKTMPPAKVLCISICPCFVPPCCSARRRVAWRQVLSSLSIWLSVVQIAMLIICVAARGFAPTDLNPMLGPFPDTLSKYGAKNAAAIVYRDEYWRLLTPIFLHAGVLHLGANLLMQIRLALYLEFAWGKKRFLLIYIAGGVFATLFSALLLPNSLGVGASGSLMGIMGAWFAFLIAEWGTGSDEDQATRTSQLILCVVNTLVIIGFSFVPYIDYAAHLFGLLGGALVGTWLFAIFPTPSKSAPTSPSNRRATSGAAAADQEISAKRRYFAAFCFFGYFCALAIGLYVLMGDLTPPTRLLNICESLRTQGYDISCN